MKKKTIKCLLVICLMIFAHEVLAQVQPFTTTLVKGDFYNCDMNEDVMVEEIEKGDNKIWRTWVKVSIQSAKGYDCDGFIDISSFREELATLCNNAKTFKGNLKLTESYPLQIYLENGEKLTTTNNTFFDQRKVEIQNSNICIGTIMFQFLKMHSNKVSLNSFDDYDKIRYVAEQLRTYSITKITINGVTIDFGTFYTKDTFNAMFNTLGEKIGEPEKFRYNSSSSSTQAAASATGEIGYMAILSGGDFLCRIDNINIKGAQGKDVSILVILEDTKTGEDALVLDKKINPPYESTSYKSLFLKRNVQDKYSWSFPNNGGTFKVYAEFYDVSGKTYPLIGKTGSKRITIYRKSSGSWGSY